MIEKEGLFWAFTYNHVMISQLFILQGEHVISRAINILEAHILTIAFLPLQNALVVKCFFLSYRIPSSYALRMLPAR